MRSHRPVGSLQSRGAGGHLPGRPHELHERGPSQLDAKSSKFPAVTPTRRFGWRRSTTTLWKSPLDGLSRPALNDSAKCSSEHSPAPLRSFGGHHDGGAEAFSEQDVFEGKAGHFWQASVEKNIRAKIRRTAKRLRTFGRDLKQLTYCSSIVVPNVDGEEDFLSDELGIPVRIRDQKYIISTSTTPRKPPKHSTRISRRTLPSSRQSAAFQ